MSTLQHLVTLTRLFGLVLLASIGSSCASRSLTRPIEPPEYSSRGRHVAAVSESYGRTPLHFERNVGQTDKNVQFLARGAGYTMFLGRNDATLLLTTSSTHEKRGRQRWLREATRQPSRSTTSLRMTFVGASTAPQVEGSHQLPGRANYFKGNDPAKWRANVPLYAKVEYENLYPGIDLVYYGNQRQLEYDFIVSPGADPGRIRLRFEGANTIEVDADGNLLIHTANGTVRQRKPLIFQEAGARRQQIAGGYVLREDHEVQFHVASYDKSRPLVIDPILFYSTNLGGSDSEEGRGVAVDTAGNAYVTGATYSLDFPVSGQTFDPTFNGGEQDAFVTKLDPTGSSVVYSTYLGGFGQEAGSAIAVDGFGNAYITGVTESVDFPITPGALDTTLEVSNGFVTKLNAGGTALLYSTYIDAGPASIALDLGGNAYLTGYVGSITPTPGAPDSIAAGSEGFAAKLNPTGSGLVYATYLGGSADDFGTSIVTDSAGNAYIAGLTASADFPTTLGAFDVSLNTQDGFITKLDPTGSVFLYSTYIGGSTNDYASSVAVDSAGNAYAAGVTNSTDFPTTIGAFDTTFNGGGPFLTSDAFLIKLNALGTGLVYATYIGGSTDDQGYAVAVDVNANAHVVGSTDSVDFPITVGAFQPNLAGGHDIFITKFNTAGSGLVYSTFLGGTGGEAPGDSIALDAFAVPNLYTTGTTDPSNFPTTPGAFDSTTNGQDAIVAQISDVVTPPGPLSARVRGGGTIDVTGGVASFHFVVQRATDGTLSGRLQYFNRETGAKVRSEMITALTVIGNSAAFDGTCTVDGAPCTFSCDVTDNGEPGTNDTFTISVSGGPTEGGVLRSGNISIQQ